MSSYQREVTRNFPANKNDNGFFSCLLTNKEGIVEAEREEFAIALGTLLVLSLKANNREERRAGVGRNKSKSRSEAVEGKTGF